MKGHASIMFIKTLKCKLKLKNNMNNFLKKTAKYKAKNWIKVINDNKILIKYNKNKFKM